jgi:hypothetical protein
LLEFAHLDDRDLYRDLRKLRLASLGKRRGRLARFAGLHTLAKQSALPTDLSGPDLLKSSDSKTLI